MKYLILFALLSVNANAYESGSAPFCKMDNFGNLQCYYYTLTQCEQAIMSFEMARCVFRGK